MLSIHQIILSLSQVLEKVPFEWSSFKFSMEINSNSKMFPENSRSYSEASLIERFSINCILDGYELQVIYFTEG